MIYSFNIIVSMEKDPVVDFLEYVLKALVDKPEAVVVTRTVDAMGVLMSVAVDPEDMGKVIGRKGATAKAIRTILRVVGMKYQQRVNMKIDEPEGSVREPKMSVTAASAEEVEDAIAGLKEDFA